MELSFIEMRKTTEEAVTGKNKFRFGVLIKYSLEKLNRHLDT